MQCWYSGHLQSAILWIFVFLTNSDFRVQGWRLWWAAKDKAGELAENAPEYYAQARDKSTEYYKQARQTAGDVSDYVMETKDYVTGDVKERDESGKWWKWALWGKKAREEEEAKRYGTVRTHAKTLIEVSCVVILVPRRLPPGYSFALR